MKWLWDVAEKKSPLQALGLYVAWLLLVGVLLSGLAGGAGEIFLRSHGVYVSKSQFEVGRIIGHIVAIVMCPLLSAYVLFRKGRLGSPLGIGMVFLSFFLALIQSSPAGLIPSAALTLFSRKQLAN